MMHFGILHAFLTQSFIQGPAAKASHPADLLVHTFATLKDLWWAALSAVIVLAIWCGLCAGPKATRRRIRREFAEGRSAGAHSWARCHRGLIPGTSPLGLPGIPVFQPELPAKPTIYASLMGSGLLLFYYSWRFLSRNLSRRQSQFALFASISFAVAFMTSLSFPAFEAMTLPGLALILAVFLNDFEGWRRFAVYAACGIVLFSQTQAKERMPFGFADWIEPSVKDATMASSLPSCGILTSTEHGRFRRFDHSHRAEHSTPNDTIFVYPELGFFYGATNEGPRHSLHRTTSTLFQIRSRGRRRRGCSEPGRPC